MTYCTQADWVHRYSEPELIYLTNRGDDEAVTVDTTVLGEVQDDVDSEINGYLSDGGYTLPLATIPGALVRRAAAMIRYYLYWESRPEQVIRDYEAALDWLERVAAGKIDLPSGPPEDAPSGKPYAAERTVIFDSDLWDTYSQ